jgi:hypothetical protein
MADGTPRQAGSQTSPDDVRYARSVQPDRAQIGSSGAQPDGTVTLVRTEGDEGSSLPFKKGRRETGGPRRMATRGQEVAVTDDEVQRLIEAMDLVRARWISGDGEFSEDAPFRQADDMTIFGPFGGSSPRPGDLSPEALAAAQAATSAQFHGGEGSCEVVRTIVEGDLVVLVMIERSAVMFEGRDAPHPWILRTTQIFRRADDQQWVRLHRHADPLILRRPLDATLDLLEDA